MNKSDLDKLLKAGSEDNRFTVDGDYLVFDKQSNLSFEISPKLKLGDLLTANPVSLTRINKNIVLSLVNVYESYEGVLSVRASYRSPEYNLLTFGLSQSDLYSKGDALSLKCDGDIDALVDQLKEQGIKEIGVYDWGVHFGYSKTEKFWDTRADQSFKQKFVNLILNDKMKNLLLPAAILGGVWFFFFRNK